ncbi:MAG: hypothetical protein WC522_09100 [Candidatus Omnitrophota bacterium]
MVKNKKLYWIWGALAAAVGFVLVEGSLVATTKLFGIIKATLIRVVFTIPLSWLVIFLCSGTNTSDKVRSWFLKKQAALSHRAQVAISGGKFFVIINTAILLGPILASILMVMVGINKRRIYLYAALLAILCAWAWCSFYGGVCWTFTKVLRG